MSAALAVVLALGSHAYSWNLNYLGELGFEFVSRVVDVRVEAVEQLRSLWHSFTRSLLCAGSERPGHYAQAAQTVSRKASSIIAKRCGKVHRQMKNYAA